jgi:hypothetical protein
MMKKRQEEKREPSAGAGRSDITNAKGNNDMELDFNSQKQTN